MIQSKKIIILNFKGLLDDLINYNILTIPRKNVIISIQ